VFWLKVSVTMYFAVVGVSGVRCSLVSMMMRMSSSSASSMRILPSSHPFRPPQLILPILSVCCLFFVLVFGLCLGVCLGGIVITF
jgi:hypothetical protein